MFWVNWLVSVIIFCSKTLELISKQLATTRSTKTKCPMKLLLKNRQAKRRSKKVMNSFKIGTDRYQSSENHSSIEYINYSECK